MYNLNDISVVIPTYNRAEDIKKTIDSFKKVILRLNEVLIIDQSKNDEVERLIKSMKDGKIKYFHIDVPSLTKARNFGIKNLSKKSSIVVFLDDDVTLDKDYFNEILKIFNKFPDALGVGGYYLPPEKKKTNLVETALRRLFLIEHLELNNTRVLSSYGNTYPSRLTKTIKSQWIPGFNMAFKIGTFDEFSFDENLSGYALAEDFDFSYRIYKKHPGALFISPDAKLVHRASIVERHPTEKASYMNQTHHFYLNFKNFNSSLREKLTFFWVIFGISLLRTIQFLSTLKTADKLKLKYYFKSLAYSLFNLNRIRKGYF